MSNGVVTGIGWRMIESAQAVLVIADPVAVRFFGMVGIVPVTKPVAQLIHQFEDGSRSKLRGYFP